MNQIDKEILRKNYRNKRKNISVYRRKNALRDSLDDIIKKCRNHKYVLSYSSFLDEFCMNALNHILEEDKKLVLPKVDGEKLAVYKIENSEEQLIKSKWGIMEPNPEVCEEVDLSEISLVLVPGVAFDSNHHRIGYGGGFYDRFLSQLPSSAVFIGVGYKEQLSEMSIPTEHTDIPLSELLLY